jgi:hypothetical protein
MQHVPPQGGGEGDEGDSSRCACCAIISVRRPCNRCTFPCIVDKQASMTLSKGRSKQAVCARKAASIAQAMRASRALTFQELEPQVFLHQPQNDGGQHPPYYEVNPHVHCHACMPAASEWVGVGDVNACAVPVWPSISPRSDHRPNFNTSLRRT